MTICSPADPADPALEAGDGTAATREEEDADDRDERFSADGWVDGTGGRGRRPPEGDVRTEDAACEATEEAALELTAGGAVTI
jgi:hypothetical protein